MPAIPLWMHGKHITAVEAILQTVDPSNGNLAASNRNADDISLVTTTGSSTANPQTIAHTVGLIDEIQVRASKTNEPISSVTSTKGNRTPIALSYEITLTEILRTGAGNSLLAYLWTTTDGSQNLSRVVRLIFARAGNKWTGYFLMKRYQERGRRTKNTGQMTLAMVDPGQANAQYATGDR